MGGTSMKAHRILVAVLAATIAASVFAQVSPQAPVPAVPDRLNRLTTIQGKIRKTEWTNPRVNLYIDVTDPDHVNVSWVVEITGSPNEWSAKGIKAIDLKVGRTVQATGTPTGGNRLEAPISGISFPQ